MLSLFIPFSTVQNLLFYIVFKNNFQREFRAVLHPFFQPLPKFFHAAAIVGDTMVVYGGRSGFDKQASADLLAYKINCNSWHTLSKQGKHFFLLCIFFSYAFVGLLCFYSFIHSIAFSFIHSSIHSFFLSFIYLFIFILHGSLRLNSKCVSRFSNTWLITRLHSQRGIIFK